MEWLVDLHSIWRWAVLVLALAAVVLAVLAASGSRQWDATTDRVSLFFTIALDIQFLIGAILWIVQARWNAADPVLSLVHPLLMIGAVALAHVGRARADRATGDKEKGRTAAIYFGASLVLMLAGIPLYAWPL